jgi:ATP-dependent DNA helicase RecG
MPRGDRFVTTLWLHSLLDETELAWLKTLGRELTAAQRQALVVARRIGMVTNSGLRDLTGLDPLQARRELQGLRDAGLLTMRGERGGAYYVLTGSFQPGGAAEQVPGYVPMSRADRPDLPADRPDLGTDRPDLPADRPDLEMDRPDLPAADRPDLGADRPDLVVNRAELPGELAATIEGLGDRPRQESLRAVIERLCAWRTLRPAQIGALLGIRPDNLTKRHLSAMVEEGRLTRTHPENLNHPDQAYQARQGSLIGAKPEDPSNAR